MYQDGLLCGPCSGEFVDLVEFMEHKVEREYKQGLQIIWSTKWNVGVNKVATKPVSSISMRNVYPVAVIPSQSNFFEVCEFSPNRKI